MAGSEADRTGALRWRSVDRFRIDIDAMNYLEGSRRTRVTKSSVRSPAVAVIFQQPSVANVRPIVWNAACSCGTHLTSIGLAVASIRAPAIVGLTPAGFTI